MVAWEAEEMMRVVLPLKEGSTLGNNGFGGIGKVVPYQDSNWSRGWRGESSES